MAWQNRWTAPGRRSAVRNWWCSTVVHNGKQDLFALCKKVLTRNWSAEEQLVWIAFLMESVPSEARREWGAAWRATHGSAGPTASSHRWSPSSPIASIATDAPSVINLTTSLQILKTKLEMTLEKYGSASRQWQVQFKSVILHIEKLA